MLVGIPLETRAAAAEILREAGVTLPRLEDALAASRRASLDAPERPPGGDQIAPAARGDDAGQRSTAAGAQPGLAAGGPGSLLAKYARDLTGLAAAGKIDPVIGRDAETRRVMQILGRRSKNNPILIGDPGVGKTAVVEGLAIAHRPRRRPDQPRSDKRIFTPRRRLADRRGQVPG